MKAEWLLMVDHGSGTKSGRSSKMNLTITKFGWSLKMNSTITKFGRLLTMNSTIITKNLGSGRK
jgi:hypothetical protein